MIHDLLWFGFQLSATTFVLGVASIVFETEARDNDDDDDFDGGIMQPCYATSR